MLVIAVALLCRSRVLGLLKPGDLTSSRPPLAPSPFSMRAAGGGGPRLFPRGLRGPGVALRAPRRAQPVGQAAHRVLPRRGRPPRRPRRRRLR